MANKKYTVLGDALLNTAATLVSVLEDQPQSIRVKNSVLSEAFRSSGRHYGRRHDSHLLAELYEGLIGYAYLHSVLRIDDLVYQMRGKQFNRPEVYVEILERVLSVLKVSGVVEVLP